MIKISVIIPVYNVEKYIGRCLSSIFAQTYTNWEIILIDDESTDDSYTICEEIVSQYKGKQRIVISAHKNVGPGATRNEGITYATGEYLFFIDADDWIESDCFEKSVEAIECDDLDIVTFFMREIYEDREWINKRTLIGKEVTNEKECGRLLGRDMSIGTKIYRRSMIIENDIWYGIDQLEDLSFQFLSYMYSKRVRQLPFAFYNYERRNLNSLTHGQANRIQTDEIKETTEDTQKTLDEWQRIIHLMKERNLWEVYGKSVRKAFQIFYERSFNIGYHEKCIDLVKQFYKDNFPDKSKLLEARVCVWGSYTSRCAVKKFILAPEKTVHYQFSSLIAAMQEKTDEKEIIHPSAFRKEMIAGELRRRFQKEIEQGKYDYLVFDLLEERFGIVDLDGMKYTESDAFNECNKTIDDALHMKRESSDVDEMWREACDKFCGLINRANLHKVIMVKNYLCEKHGSSEGVIDFDDLGDIRKTNETLDRYYHYIENKIDGIQVIDTKDIPQFFSDEYYRYGCYPWHTSDSFEHNLGDAIEEIIS